jgi:cytoskeletal protein RodZ
MCRPSTPNQRVLCFWCLCVFATAVVGAIIALVVTQSPTHANDPTTDSSVIFATTAQPSSAAPTSATPTTARPTSATPTTSPTAPSISDDDDDNSTTTTTTVLAAASTPASWSPPPLLITLCTLTGAAVLILCFCVAWKHRAAPAKYAPAARYEQQQQPAPVAAEETTDLQAELRQVDAIRARHAAAPKPQNKWRLADVSEEDIVDMDDMPAITAIHYGLSPSETLEGDQQFNAAAADDDDDDDATLVLNH